MSVKAKIIIDDEEINVLQFSFGFNQGADTNGRPSQKPVFVGLQLVIETRKDLNLADWSFASNQTKQIELHIYPVVMGGKTRKLYFYDCHLVNWNNHFSSTGNKPMSETLEITCAGVKYSNSMEEYSANWRVTFPQQEVEPTVREEAEAEITEVYFTDLEGEIIPKNKLKRGEKVKLVIKTLNATGKEIAIDLDNNALDFEYGDHHLEEDILKLNISADTMTIELTTIAQQN